MLHNICNMGSHDCLICLRLPSVLYMYTLESVHTYQENHSCSCYMSNMVPHRINSTEMILLMGYTIRFIAKMFILVKLMFICQHHNDPSFYIEIQWISLTAWSVLFHLWLQKILSVWQFGMTQNEFCTLLSIILVPILIR